MKPSDVAEFYADFDRHPGDRIRLFAAVRDFLPNASQVLYAGSYVDIAPSVWFDDVVYVDTDKRAARFFSEHRAVESLVAAKRLSVRGGEGTASIDFHHLDYQTQLPIDDESVDVVVSLYAGFVSEHCTRYLRVGGHLLVNPSHGDVAMASLDDRYELVAVVNARDGKYRVSADKLDSYLVPKKPQTITVERLHELGRGIAYTKSPFAYVFQRVR